MLKYFYNYEKINDIHPPFENGGFLSKDGTMKIKSGKEKEYQEYKERNLDDYGKPIIIFSEKWAELMEKEISTGKTIGEVYDKKPKMGLSGFQVECAVIGLCNFWEHGDDLRRVWYSY